MLEKHLLPFDVVNESEALESDAVLAIAGLHANEFFDRMGAADVVWVYRKNGDGLAVLAGQIGMIGRAQRFGG